MTNNLCQLVGVQIFHVIRIWVACQ